MDTMEDSGFDSDPKVIQHEMDRSLKQDDPALAENGTTTLLPKASELQKKMEKQLEAARKAQALEQQQKKGILSRSRLLVPHKPKSMADINSLSPDAQPLVLLESDESDDEFAMPQLSKQAQKEITQQLIKDGYNLDLEPDDEDLDLIPPRPMSERCACCPSAYIRMTSCTLQ